MSSTRTTIGGRELTVSNLDKVLFPATGFTKGQLIDYYVRAADAMLPHLRDRPLTMKRFPDGVDSKFFFEKHIPSHAPEWVASVTVPSSDGHEEIEYAMVNDLPTLAWAANLGTIELHVPLWRAGPRRRKLPANPDLMVFDLDPGEGTTIVECCSVAEYVSDELAEAGMVAFAKTSGSKGLQVYAATKPRTTWNTQREQAHEIARKLEAEHRDLIVSNMRRSLRRRRVLIDWSQNHMAKTTVSVYSVRAMPEPTVSTPVTASEVRNCIKKKDPGVLRFTTDEVLRRLEKHGDLLRRSLADDPSGPDRHGLSREKDTFLTARSAQIHGLFTATIHMRGNAVEERPGLLPLFRPLPSVEVHPGRASGSQPGRPRSRSDGEL